MKYPPWQRWIFIALVLQATVVSAVDRTPTATSTELKVFYTSNRHGEIEPCGCQVGQIGGLDRLWTFLNQERPLGTAALFVDAGDAFFPSTQLNKFQRSQDVLRAKLIAEAYRLVNLDFLSPGPRDLAEGWDFLRELERLSGATFVSTNVKPKKGPPFKKSAQLTVGGYRVGILSAARKEDFPNAIVTPWRKEIQDEIARIRKNVDVIIVLSHLGLMEDRDLASLAGVDMIVGSRSLDVIEKPVQVEKALIVQPSLEGQQIGLLAFRKGFPEQAKHRLINLDPQYALKNPVTELVERYRDKVRELAVSDSSTPAEKKGTFVAKPHFCKNCHTEQYAFWEKTKHASAYLVLYAKNQHFDPECVSCHSLGFRSEGGFSKIAKPFELSDEKAGQEPLIEAILKQTFKKDPGKGPLDSRVEPARYATLKKEYHKVFNSHVDSGKIVRSYVSVQCEHCHGIREGHPDPKVKTLKKVVEGSCLQCHTPPNDTDFKFSALVGKVACPLIKR